MIAKSTRWVPLAAALALLGSGCERSDLAPTDAHATLRTREDVAPHRVAALGRLEPRDGILRVAGPSRPSVVVRELLVREGDVVEAGAAIAVLDTRAYNAARVRGAEAAVSQRRRELARTERLHRRGIVPTAELDDERGRVAVAEAELEMARADLAQDTVRAPAAGQVVRVRARAGERVGSDGVLELAQNDAMYAVAEVYETDVGQVRVGQPATARSPALEAPLHGTVERIGMLVGRQDVLEPDPAAMIDARVVEVHVRLDDPARVAAFSNLQVEVTIDTSEP